VITSPSNMPLKLDVIAEVIEACNMNPKHYTSFHIAILYRRGKILAMASNTMGSRSKGCGYSKHTIHAERAVIKKVGDITKLKGAELFVVRLSKSREMLDSEPCHACKCHLTKCMREYGLKAVYYS
jgi:hypothetical protein